MGYTKLSDRVGREQSHGNGNRIWDGDIDSGVLSDKIKKMAESKVVILILNLIGIPLYLYTWAMNLDNIKGTILLVIAAMFGISKLFFYWKRSFQALHKEEQEAAMREIQLNKEREMLNKIRIDNIEKELSVRVTGLTPEQRKDRDNKKGTDQKSQY